MATSQLTHSTPSADSGTSHGSRRSSLFKWVERKEKRAVVFPLYILLPTLFLPKLLSSVLVLALSTCRDQRPQPISSLPQHLQIPCRPVPIPSPPLFHRSTCCLPPLQHLQSHRPPPLRLHANSLIPFAHFQDIRRNSNHRLNRFPLHSQPQFISHTALPTVRHVCPVASTCTSEPVPSPPPSAPKAKPPPWEPIQPVTTSSGTPQSNSLIPHAPSLFTAPISHSPLSTNLQTSTSSCRNPI